MAFIPNTDVVALLDSTRQRQQVITSRRGFSQLLTIARNNNALKQRFPGWPEAELNESDLACLFQPERLEQQPESGERLLRTGLLRRESAGFQVTVPIYEQMRSQSYFAQVNQFGGTSAEKLASFVDRLRQEWQSEGGLPQWDQIAHNLVIGFLGGAFAGQALLQLYEKPAAVLLIADAGQMPGNWFTFFRVRPDLALVDTMGASYPACNLLRRLLQTREIAQTLASVDERGQLVMYGDKALKLLRQLSGYRKTSPGPWMPDDYWLNWPVLSPTLLARVKDALRLVCRAMVLVLRELKALLDQSPLPPALKPEDIAFTALIDLLGALHDILVARCILPEAAAPWLDDWQLPDAGASLRSEMLKGLGR